MAVFFIMFQHPQSQTSSVYVCMCVLSFASMQTSELQNTIIIIVVMTLNFDLMARHCQ